MTGRIASWPWLLRAAIIVLYFCIGFLLGRGCTQTRHSRAKSSGWIP